MRTVLMLAAALVTTTAGSAWAEDAPLASPDRKAAFVERACDQSADRAVPQAVCEEFAAEAADLRERVGVLHAAETGVPTAEIAAKYGLSETDVSAIVLDHEQQKADAEAEELRLLEAMEAGPPAP